MTLWLNTLDRSIWLMNDDGSEHSCVLSARPSWEVLSVDVAALWDLGAITTAQHAEIQAKILGEEQRDRDRAVQGVLALSPWARGDWGPR